MGALDRSSSARCASWCVRVCGMRASGLRGCGQRREVGMHKIAAGWSTQHA